jgi:hypothetical protein
LTNNSINYECFISVCDELCSLGASELHPGVDNNITKSPRLRSISIMNAKGIQNNPCNQPMRVLFDSGSDKTMFNFKALPKGTNPSTTKGVRGNGIHGTEILNQEVLLTGLTFPEFSPTQQVPGPVWATVFTHDESIYDVIIVMDTMQALGFDISCSTKTISWNGNIVPFKPADYFSNQQPSRRSQ